MIHIPFPEPDFTVREENGKTYIFDRIRKRMVLLSPEEWVRQNFIAYLTLALRYPAALISIEKALQLGSLNKRYDIIVYKDDRPWMMVECKEAAVEITPATLEQILRYNMALPVEYLVLTNGKRTYCIRRSPADWAFLDRLPAYG
ncbi:type I restriction enzyme HsdR N-terminal domain-containing protein [Compostibacter hankyongensis]|uniref:Type I restriction enzyme HsdR N-terminal domain-containing protein n=1 Tax=Compostibacter hankyongensis TaxID=1007089 RepID=A0ABP8FI07_9BACT